MGNESRNRHFFHYETFHRSRSIRLHALLKRHMHVKLQCLLNLPLTQDHIKSTLLYRVRNQNFPISRTGHSFLFLCSSFLKFYTIFLTSMLRVLCEIQAILMFRCKIRVERAEKALISSRGLFFSIFANFRGLP